MLIASPRAQWATPCGTPSVRTSPALSVMNSVTSASSCATFLTAVAVLPRNVVFPLMPITMSSYPRRQQRRATTSGPIDAEPVTRTKTNRRAIETRMRDAKIGDDRIAGDVFEGLFGADARGRTADHDA